MRIVLDETHNLSEAGYTSDRILADDEFGHLPRRKSSDSGGGAQEVSMDEVRQEEKGKAEDSIKEGTQKASLKAAMRELKTQLGIYLMVTKS